MEKLAAVLWGMSLLAMLAGFIANPLVLVAMIVLYGSIYLIGRWLTRERDARQESRREKWTGL